MPAAARYFFFFLGDVVRSAHNITKDMKNLLELAKFSHKMLVSNTEAAVDEQRVWRIPNCGPVRDLLGWPLPAFWHHGGMRIR